MRLPTQMMVHLPRARAGAALLPVVAGALVAAALVAPGLAAGAAGGLTMTTARAGALLAVLSLGAVARLAIPLGGLAELDFRVRHCAAPDRTDPDGAISAADAPLLGTAVAVAAVGLAGGSWLVVSETPADHALCVLAGIGLALRSRIFPRLLHAAPVLAAGAALAIAGAAGPLADRWGAAGWLLLAALAAGAGTALAADRRRPRHEAVRNALRRALNWSELAFVVAAAASAAAAFGLFQAGAGLLS